MTRILVEKALGFGIYGSIKMTILASFLFHLDLSSFHGAADIVGEYVTVAMFPEVDNQLIHEPAIERVVGDY